MSRSRFLLVPLVILVAGCMTVPTRYRQPLRVYQPRVDRLAVGGFQRTEFVQTGGFSGTAGGNNVFGAVGGWSGDYRSFSDAETMRWFLEETRCARRVDETREATLRVEGEAHGDDGAGALEWTMLIVESLTLLPVLGLPVPWSSDGTAIGRVYRDGEFRGQVGSSARLRYWTTLYTAHRDAMNAKNLARLMALRDLADQVAADLCGSRRIAASQ